jgi:Ser/Thr protein kinase RdoA (MazF antagonist)
MTKEKIPVTESTVSADYLRQFIQEAYGLDPTTTCKLFRTGINHLYFVTSSNSKFVFRIYTLNWRTKSEISEEVRLLNHLKVNDIPVSYPIADKNNSFIQELNAPEGDRFGVLFSFAPGRKLSNFTERTSFNIGCTMAKMHELTRNFPLERVTYSPSTLLIDSSNITKSFFGNTSDEMIFIDKTTRYLISEYKKVKTDEVRYGAIHLDIWFDNMHFNGEDEITIFDFDFCGNGWLCHDIAYYILQLYNTRQSDESYQKKMESFIKGYESIRKINDDEKRIIPVLRVSIWFFYLGVQCHRFDNWSNVFLSEEHLKRFLLVIKKWIDYHKLPVER